MEEVINNEICIKEEVDLDIGMDKAVYKDFIIKGEMYLNVIKEDVDEEYCVVKEEPHFIAEVIKEETVEDCVRDEELNHLEYKNQEKNNLDTPSNNVSDATFGKVNPLGDFCKSNDGNCRSKVKSGIQFTGNEQNTMTAKLSLAKRLKTRTGEKPFKCSYCDYATAHRRDLERHLRTHTGEKPFNCNYCDYAATMKATLQQHLRTHTGEKPFKCKCSYCNFAAITKAHLDYHLRTHTGEKPFKCNHCDYAATIKATLKQHLRTHNLG